MTELHTCTLPYFIIFQVCKSESLYVLLHTCTIAKCSITNFSMTRVTSISVESGAVAQLVHSQSGDFGRGAATETIAMPCRRCYMPSRYHTLLYLVLYAFLLPYLALPYLAISILSQLVICLAGGGRSLRRITPPLTGGQEALREILRSGNLRG